MGAKLRQGIVTARRIANLVILLLLLFLIFARTSESLHGRMNRLGVFLWADYFALRVDLPTPTCDPNFDIEARLNELEAASQKTCDEFDFFTETFDREAARTSLIHQKEMCREEYARVARYHRELTPAVRIFRRIERGLAQLSLVATAQQRMLLLTLLFLASALTTAQERHIALRPMDSALSYHISFGLQGLANGLLAYSAWTFRLATTQQEASAGQGQLLMHGIGVGFTLLAVLAFFRAVAVPPEKRNGTLGADFVDAVLSLPLYTFALLVFACITFGLRGDKPALAIYFTTFFERSGTYLDVALYLWTGMLLKQTQIGERLFSLFTPWRPGPELFALVAVVLGAVPTAYTGASAIIILALGGVLYRELRKLGTRRQLALAATAMSGSSGIVLKPCLLVVLISMLNKEVVSEDLFHWGTRVFLLTAVLFGVYTFATAREPVRIVGSKDAVAASVENFRRFVPYILIAVLVLASYAVVLDAYMDQFSAPTILPVLLMAVITFERKWSRAEPIYQDPERIGSISGALRKSVADASSHIGALLLLMAAFSVMTGLAGKMVSAEFLGRLGSPWMVMTVLTVIFVLIGMFMESMAAVGMTSLIIAPVAYAQGIHPIHFWITCLVALQLGYLTPPVALSHIFCRQVVGEEEWRLASMEGDTFYYRHERLFLPLLVMGTVLLIVAFGPLCYAY